MRIALAVILVVVLATGSALGGDKRVLNSLLGGIGAFSQGSADSMEAQRQADLAREARCLEQQRVDQELAYQRAVLEQNQRQFLGREATTQ